MSTEHFTKMRNRLRITTPASHSLDRNGGRDKKNHTPS